MAYCTFISPHLERLRELRGLAAQLALEVARERVRRQAARRVARMHARLLHVLHDAADHDLLSVGHAVDIDLDRVGEIAIEQHRRVVGDLDRLLHVALELGLLVDDLHRAAAEHVAGAPPPGSRSPPRASPLPRESAVRLGGWRA